MNYLKTLLRDKNGVPIENTCDHYSSLPEVRLAVAAKDAIHPGCCMWVWKSCQDHTCETPFKFIRHVKRRRAGAKRRQVGR